MLPAIEAAAQRGTAAIDRASRFAQVHAGAAWRGGERVCGASGRIHGGLNAVRRDIVALRWIERQILISAAARGTTPARHAGQIRGRHTIL